MEVIEIMGEQQEIVNTLNRLVPREGTGNLSHKTPKGFGSTLWDIHI